MIERTYLEIPGNSTHELPPLLVHGNTFETTISLEEIAAMVEADEMIPPQTMDQRDMRTLERIKYDLASNLVNQYSSLVSHWQWGDSIIEWIRQCEITFETNEVLRKFLHPDVWPHASRSSFVHLLVDKHVDAGNVALERAVGLRLTFRQPPPIDCISNQFLFYLNSPVAETAYQSWAHLSTDSGANLPPDRFHFQVHQLTLPM
jgi:hypothetical protein